MRDTWIHRARPVGVALGVAGGTFALFAVLGVVVLRTNRPASTAWTEFSIGPASGRSASIGPSVMRSDGITLKVALATAYDIPAVRVIAPPWLAETRYAITAALPADATGSFRALLQQELNSRLRLETHFETRPFDVFVLTATDDPRLERASGTNVRTWINDWNAQLQSASMERLASAIEGILGRPAIDETGITGSYDLELEWTENRIASVTAVLRDRFGLRLTPANREMEALVVDGIRRDAALVLLAQIGRITSGAPPRVRQRITDILTIR